MSLRPAFSSIDSIPSSFLCLSVNHTCLLSLFIYEEICTCLKEAGKEIIDFAGINGSSGNCVWNRGRESMGNSGRGKDTGRLAEAGVQALADFVKEMGLPKQNMTKIDQNNCNFIIDVL